MPPGSFIVTGLKNLKQLTKALKVSSTIYTFSQRKNNRLVGLFYVSCMANLALLKLIERAEVQICQDHKQYIDLVRESDEIHYAGK